MLHPEIDRRPVLAALVTAADYTARVAQVVERIALANDQAEALALLKAAAAALGAENAVFMSHMRHSIDNASCHFLLACDPAWCQRYLALGSLAHDPWMAYAAHHSEPVLASSLAAAGSESRAIRELANQCGFASAVLVPAHSGPGHGRVSLLVLGSPVAGYFEGEGYARFRLGARLLAAELHDWWQARIRRELVLRSRITDADLALLRHQCQGHSSKRIASELQLSLGSINSRFQRINTRLGVHNRRQAARLAMACGLIVD